MSLIKRKETSDKVQAIKVFPRIRPMNNIERECKAHAVLDAGESTISLKNMHSVKKYSFDHVFHNTTSQQELYDIVVSPMIFEVLSGFSCTVFAYGQTGTGKTFTMAGGTPEESGWREDKRAGVVPRALAQLFELLNGREANVRVSYIELYNEEIIDLLSDDDPTSRIRLYDDQKQKGSVIIQGAEEVIVRDKNEVYALLDKGMCKRQTAATLMNASSSRSHTVFIITVHTREISAEGEEMVKVGKLYLVDLAGSENIAKSGATDKRARETAMINQSLLTLGRVIHALVGNNSHVPYRESKLTRILQDSLGGRSKTSLIITVSPASTNLEETINTLEYGSRARNIHNRPEVNQRMSKTLLIGSYVEEIEKLKKDLAASRTKDGVFLHADNYDRMMEEKRQNSDELLNRINEIKAFQERIDLLNTKHKQLERNFSITESAMQHFQGKLDHCKIDLVKLKKKNKIRDIYIKKVLDIEDRNTNCFTTLRDFAQKAYENECYMHIKMEQCYEVFVNNYESGRHALNESEEMKTDLSENVHRLANKISVQIKENVSTVIQNNKSVGMHISDFKNNINNKHRTIHQSQQIIAKIATNIIRASDVHSNNSAEFHSTLLQLVSSLNEDMATMQEFLTSTGDVLEKLRVMNDSQVSITKANSRLQLNDINALSKQIVENAQNKLKIRRNDLKVVAEETKSNEILCQDGYKYAADIKEKLQICSSNIDKIASIYSTTLYQCDRQFKALDTIDTKTNEESKFWKDFSESSKTTLKNNIERVWNVRQQEIERLNPEYDVLLSEIKKSTGVVSLCKEFYIGEVDKVISQNTESVEELADTIKDIAIELETEVKLTTGTSDETLKETTGLCEELTPLLESDDMKNTIDQILEMTNSVDEKLPQLINRFEQFITRDMKRVNPSGNTPVKAILNELPGDRRIPTQIMKNWASQINKYDQNHEDSFDDQDNINPDISINLDSSLLSQSSILESNDATEQSHKIAVEESSITALE